MCINSIIERCMISTEQVARFIYEMGMLKRVSREGWKLIGLDHPESVAAHSLRAAQIGFILASMEEYDQPEHICTMLVFHDIGECRIGDIHKVGRRYIHSDEQNVVKDQVKDLQEIGEKILELYDQIEMQNTREGIIGKDADLLEMAATACEYKQQGYYGTEDWLKNTKKRLKTKSAKDLFRALEETNPVSWWDGLKKITF
jgi:putative hydrolases of HD superfamily